MRGLGARVQRSGKPILNRDDFQILQAMQDPEGKKSEDTKGLALIRWEAATGAPEPGAAAARVGEEAAAKAWRALGYFGFL